MVRHLVRAADADLLDTFLVAAVAAIVVIRIFLGATGYPQLGGGGRFYCTSTTNVKLFVPLAPAPA
jgi:hypothetical protein